MRSLSINPRNQSIQYIYSFLRRATKPTDICSLPGISLARQPSPTIVLFAKVKAFVSPFHVIESPEGCSAQDARNHLISFLADHPYNTAWKLTQVILAGATITFYFQDSTDRRITLQGDSFYFPEDFAFSLCTADNERLDLSIYPKGIQLSYQHDLIDDQCTLYATNQSGPRTAQSEWLLHHYQRNDW